MRRILLFGIAMLASACARGGDEPLRRADGEMLSSSGGEVELADGSRLQFLITSQRYKQWEAARAGLRKNVVARFGALLQPKSPTEKSIQRATAFLETDVTSREAIERTGMSVRDFVLMTVALEQEMRVASRIGTRPVAPEPPLGVLDSGVKRPIIADSPASVDSVIRDSVARPDTSRNRSIDSLRAPPPRDTARDTLPSPPDSTARS